MDSPHRCVALRPVGASTEAGREGRGLIWDEDMESSRSQAGVPRRKGKDEAAQVLLSVGETGCLQNGILLRAGSALGELSQRQYGRGPTATVSSHRGSFSLSLAGGGRSHTPQGGGTSEAQCGQSPPVGSRFPGGAGGLSRQGVSVGPPRTERTPCAAGAGTGETARRVSHGRWSLQAPLPYFSALLYLPRWLGRLGCRASVLSPPSLPPQRNSLIVALGRTPSPGPP